MESMIARQSGRLDRYVRRSYLRLNEGDSRHRIAYAIEEALRLAEFPGENEGRIYCFRRINFSAIPAEANRRFLIQSVQRVLASVASQAVHASDPNAGASNAVYFHNREEALEYLLRRALSARSSKATAAPAWYSASLLGRSEELSEKDQVSLIVEQLLDLGPSGFVTAPGAPAILFAALEDNDPEPLLSAISPEAIREWIRRLDGAPTTSTELPALSLPPKLKTILLQAVAVFGWKDPAAVWLAAQAVLCVMPSALYSSTAIRCARTVLRVLESEQRGESLDHRLSRRHDPKWRSIVFDEEEPTVKGLGAATAARPLAAQSVNGDYSRLADRDTSLPAPPLKEPALPQQIRSKILISDEVIAPVPLRGEFTTFAGLYFLLNALHHLGMAASVKACPALHEADFALHVLRRFAAHAQIPEGDPSLCCLPALGQEFTLPIKTLSAIQTTPECRPRVFAGISAARFDSDFLLRLWSVAVRWWCWRVARLSVGEIVNRPGRVWLTRADLDVTLPLEQTDLRIRRAGLDIDPGYVPWFGPWGRVVRFHYRDQEGEAQPC
ncbi:MAG: hypothetical protein ABSD59_15555 [Terracidiphilus sp.]|jgi:AcrR family transcriptional regulator